jgi:hypothetical protein
MAKKNFKRGETSSFDGAWPNNWSHWKTSIVFLIAMLEFYLYVLFSPSFGGSRPCVAFKLFLLSCHQLYDLSHKARPIVLHNRHKYSELRDDFLFLLFSFIYFLFICTYNVWVISPPFPQPPSLPPHSLPLPLIPSISSRNYLPLSLILLKRKYKQ